MLIWLCMFAYFGSMASTNMSDEDRCKHPMEPLLSNVKNKHLSTLVRYKYMYAQIASDLACVKIDLAVNPLFRLSLKPYVNHISKFGYLPICQGISCVLVQVSYVFPVFFLPHRRLLLVKTKDVHSFCRLMQTNTTLKYPSNFGDKVDKWVPDSSSAML